MVTPPNFAQGIEFNIQYFTCILNLAITEVPGYSTSYIHQIYKVMRQRFECIFINELFNGQ